MISLNSCDSLKISSVCGKLSEEDNQARDLHDKAYHLFIAYIFVMPHEATLIFFSQMLCNRQLNDRG